MTQEIKTATTVRNKLPREKYPWGGCNRVIVIAGRKYKPPTQDEVQRYYKEKGHPHPWRCWDTGARFIAFGRKVDMRSWGPDKNPNYNYPTTDILGITTPVCGTAGCHAGTAAVIIPNLTGAEYFEHEFGVYILSVYLTGARHHQDSIVSEIENWAFANCNTWGNQETHNIFSRNTTAFNKPRGWILTSEQIGRWWQQVAERIARIEV